jgi:hypothetical protein
MRIPVNPDPAETVVGIRARYHCPDLETIDEHLRNLSNRLKAVGDGAPKLVGEYRHDIDLLLARRLYLTTTDEDDECPAQ